MDTKIVTSFIAMIIVLVLLISTGCENISFDGTPDDYEKVKGDLDTALSRIEELENERDILQTENQQLGEEIDGLQDSCDILQTENQQLEDEKDNLQVELSGLNEDYQALQTQNDTLETDKQLLEDQKNNLQTENDALVIERDGLQSSYNSLVTWYESIRDQVNPRHGLMEDMKLFVTPNDSTVVAIVQSVTGGFSENVNEQWVDIKNMYDWVVSNIEYNSDSRLPYLPLVDGSLTWRMEYWRTPGETIEDEVGDCEDMATLLASMILNYFSSAGYPCWCVTWLSDESAHAAVAIPVQGDKLTILDPAGNYYTGTPGSLGSEDVSVAVEDWLAHWSGEPGIYLSSVFSNTLYETFATTDDFIDWALT